MKVIDDNGSVTLPFGGAVRTFKFGYKSLSFYEQIAVNLTGNIEAIAGMLYSGLMAKKQDNNLPEDFSLETVLDWMDDETEDTLADLFTIGKKRVASLSSLGQKIAEADTPKKQKPTG